MVALVPMLISIVEKTDLGLTILVAVVTNEPFSAVDEEVDVASFHLGVKEIAPRACVVGVLLSFAVPKPLEIQFNHFVACLQFKLGWFKTVN